MIKFIIEYLVNSIISILFEYYCVWLLIFKCVFDLIISTIILNSFNFFVKLSYMIEITKSDVQSL